MAETLEESLKSILNQVDNRFEILVVDDASTDNSQVILDELVAENEQLRTLCLNPDPDRKLGETRNISVREANGEYVLLHLDADDIYQDGTILDFVYVFHKLEAAVGADTVIQIPGIRMASRRFLLNMGPYRNLPVGGEDMDFWRRLLDKDAFIYIDAEPPHRSIGYEKTVKSLIKRWYRVAVSDFQSKITFRSYLVWTFMNHSLKRIGYYLLALPVAYIDAAFRETLPAPPAFRKKGALPRRLDAVRTPLSELEEAYGVNIDRSQLSENGQRIFYSEEITTDTHE